MWWGGGEYFKVGGGGQEKIYLCKEGHYMMKNTNKGVGGGCQHKLISKKGPNAKMRKKCQKLSNIENFFPRSFSLGILQNSYFWSS